MPSIPMPGESKAYVLDEDPASIDPASMERIPDDLDPDNPLGLQPGDQGFIRLDNGEDIPVEVVG